MDRFPIDTFLRRGSILLANAASKLPGERPPWVVVELQGSYPARETPRRLLAFPPELGPRDPSLERLTEDLDALASAPWCAGVVFRFGPTSFGASAGGALRSQIERLREAGKQTVAWLGYPSLFAYWAATAADRVVVHEAVTDGSWGLAAEALYWGAAAERVGIEFERMRIREYKTAFETFSRASMSEAQREQITALLESIEGSLVEDIAKARGRTPDEAREWLQRPPIGRDAMVERGLADGAAYEDEVVPDEAAQFPQIRRFLERPLPAMAGRVGVITLAGTIVPGESRRSPVPLPWLGDAFAGSETAIRALRAAAADASTKAVVLYVDSGGGSALASDLIWREVRQLDRAKPVVAVMGDVAASGGYYVLTHARHVVAAPTTVTGSIGVLAGKFVLAALYERLGVRAERIALHRYAGMYTSSKSFDDDERAFVESSVQETYAQFTRRVAEGRRMPLERVDEVGRGRVWSGIAALERGLVDELGDIRTGIERAKEIAGLPADAAVWNVRPPRATPRARSPEDVAAWVGRIAAERFWMLPEVPVRLVG